MTSLMTSSGHKVGQILKLIYIRQYLSSIVNKKLKMSGMLMVIFLVYSTSDITSGKKSLSGAQNGSHFENFEIINTASIWPQIWKYRPKLCQKKYFHHDDVIDDVTGWPQNQPYIFFYKWNNNIFTPQPLRAPGYCHTPERAGWRAAGQTSPVNTLTSILFHWSFSNLARTFITLRSRTRSIMEVLPH